MSKLNDLIKSLTDENVSDEDKAQIIEQIESETDELSKSNKQLYARAKKAEGFEQDKEGNWIKREEKKEESKPEAKTTDEHDYSKQALKSAQLALLNSLGFKNTKEQEYIFKEAERLKLDVNEVIGDSFHQSKLKAIKDEVEAADGMPKGNGSSGSGATSGSLEYYLAKGQAPNDPELRAEYFKARETKESNANMFSDELFSSTESESYTVE